MALYLLTRKDDVGWDEYEAKVIRASCEDEAREIANIDTGDERKIWENNYVVSCDELSEEGESLVILASFNAG